MDIIITNSGIKSIADDLPLTYRVAGREYVEGTPALAWLDKYDDTGAGYLLSFELLDPALEQYLNTDGFDIGVVNGELRQVILTVSEDDEGAILDILGVSKTYSFTTCKRNFSKICDSCKGCESHTKKENKIMEEKYFTDARGRTYRIEGEDVAEEAKTYAKEHNVSYEEALLEVSKKTKGE